MIKMCSRTDERKNADADAAAERRSNAGEQRGRIDAAAGRRRTRELKGSAVVHQRRRSRQPRPLSLLRGHPGSLGLTLSPSCSAPSVSVQAWIFPARSFKTPVLEADEPYDHDVSMYDVGRSTARNDVV